MDHTYSKLTTPISIHTHSFAQLDSAIPQYATYSINKSGEYSIPQSASDFNNVSTLVSTGNSQ